MYYHYHYSAAAAAAAVVVAAAAAVIVIVVVVNGEIQQMWYMKCFITPENTGATGIVTKGLKKYL
jgi:hypothetical protein